MTTHTPAPAQQAVLTDEEINDICERPASNTTMRAENDRALARATEQALLSKLRAPVADERAAFSMAFPAALWREGEEFPDQMWAIDVLRGWQARAALASAPVAGEAAEDAFDDGWREAANWSGRDDLLADMDSFAYKVARARCVGKLGQLAAPQASEAQCSCPSGDGSLRHPCAMHPQASEAVSDAAHPVFAFLLGEGPLRGVHFGDRHPDERGAYWWRKDLSAALSAQPGAQKSCNCATCRPHSVEMRMILCETCGDKRCPHAADHRNECTGTGAQKEQ